MENRVQEFMDLNNIRPGKFAKELHISRSHLWDIANNGAEPSVSIAMRIAKELKKPIDVVFPCPECSVKQTK